jgi:hypothetical protein
MKHNRKNIDSWPKFRSAIKYSGKDLLARRDDFPQSIYVAGCQRSGTTMLTRILAQSEGIVNFHEGKDDELDAGLILAGLVDHEPVGRYCFQTTYLNEQYREYYELDDTNKLIWVIRNPQSVIYSMLYHWRRFALNTLFKTCGISELEPSLQRRYSQYGLLSVSPIVRACCAYNAKNLQLFKLLKNMGRDRLLVLEYSDVVSRPDKFIPMVYKFVDHPYKAEYAEKVNQNSLAKSSQLSNKEKKMINDSCSEVYGRVKDLVSGT